MINYVLMVGILISLMSKRCIFIITVRIRFWILYKNMAINRQIIFNWNIKSIHFRKKKKVVDWGGILWNWKSQLSNIWFKQNDEKYIRSKVLCNKLEHICQCKEIIKDYRASNLCANSSQYGSRNCPKGNKCHPIWGDPCSLSVKIWSDSNHFNR